jgi:hypothetical protein
MAINPKIGDFRAITKLFEAIILDILSKLKIEGQVEFINKKKEENKRK